MQQITISHYFKGKNFMTPSVIRYGNKGNRLYELSEGTGFNGEPIYGVTVVTKAHGTLPVKEYDLSNVFDSLEEAEKHIQSL